MNCESIQFNLPLYLDNEISLVEKSSIDSHLKQCPLCREKLADFRELQSSFQSFAKPRLPLEFKNSLKVSIASELDQLNQKQLRTNDFFEFFKIRLMPYGIGIAVSCLFFAIFLNSLLNMGSSGNVAKVASKPAVSVSMLELPTPAIERPVDTKDFEAITSEVFAERRVGVSKQSPSLNPSGSLVNLASNLASENINEDEIVLIADVDSSGNASISSFISPPKNQSTTSMLKTALEDNKSSSPFVPANLDNRSENVQIVLLLNQVDVYENKTKNESKKP